MPLTPIKVCKIVFGYLSTMENKERERLARICRHQAVLASTPEARAALIGLARSYESEMRLSGINPVEPPAQKLE